MAISLGDAALAFAGGAAAEYNQQEAEKRQSAIRIEERNKELAEMHQYRTAETRLTNQLAEETLANQRRQQIESAGGFEDPKAQMLMMQEMWKVTPEQAARFYQTGERIDLSMYQKTNNPEETLSDARKATMGDSRMERRLGKFEEVLRTYRGENPVTTLPDDPNQPNEFSTLEMGAPEPMDIRTMEGRPSGADSSTVADIFNPAPIPELKQSGDNFYQTAYNSDTGKWEVDQINGDTSWSPLSTEGDKASDLATLREMAAADPDNPWIRDTLGTMEKLLEDDPSIIPLKGEITENGTTYNVVQGFKKDSEQGLVRVGDYYRLGVANAPGGGSTTFGQKRIQELEQSNRGIAIVADAVKHRMSFISPGQEGAPATLTRLTSAITQNITGMAELAGVPRETSQDRLEEMYQDQGFDMSEVVKELRDNNRYLVGQSDMNLGMLVYSLGGILRDTGTRRDTSEKDIQRAAQMVGMLGSSNGGLAAASELLHVLNVRATTNHQLIYTNPNAPADKRSEAAINFLKGVKPDLDPNHLIEDVTSGTMYVFPTVEDAEQAKLALSEMFSQPNGPKSVGEAFASFPENLRPESLEEVIQNTGQDGFLLPEYDPERYLNELMNGQR